MALELCAMGLFGLGIMALIEFRLRAMRDLIKLAMIGREAFDAVASAITHRLDAQGHRIDTILQVDAEDRKIVADHERRILKLEGRH